MDYPKALYRDGDDGNHNSWDGPLLVAGKHQVETMIVNDEDEELAALSEGWRDTAAPAAKEVKRGPGALPKVSE